MAAPARHQTLILGKAADGTNDRLAKVWMILGNDGCHGSFPFPALYPPIRDNCQYTFCLTVIRAGFWELYL